MNFYSSPWFIDTAAEVYFPGRRTARAAVRVDDKVFDVLVVDGRVQAAIPFLDFVEPRDDSRPGEAKARRVRYLPAVSLHSVPVDEWLEGPNPEGFHPAPYVDWRGFTAWEDFVAKARARNSRAFRKSGQKLRKLGREVGEVRFELDAKDPALLELCMSWKSAQFRATNFIDGFASGANRALFFRLLERDRLLVSVLFAGDRPLAILLSCSWQGRHSCWIASYSKDFAQYSPGVLLFEYLMQQSMERGDREFDFLLGEETYKFYYATDVRVVGPVGRPSQARQRLRSFRNHIVDGVRERYPLAYRGMQSAKRLVAQRRIERGDSVGRGGEGERGDAGDTPPPGRVLGFVDRQHCQLHVTLEHTGVRTPSWGQRVFTRIDALRFVRERVVERAKTVREWLEPGPAGEPPEPLRLDAGDLVRVKRPDEIRVSLHRGATEGLGYRPGPMDRCGGQHFRVLRRVRYAYDEQQGSIVHLKNVVVLDGACCDGARAPGRNPCDRGCALMWKEAWLERSTDSTPSDPGPVPAIERPGPQAGFAPGASVRVRPLPQILSTLDERGTVDGLAFAEETMAHRCGATYRVQRPVRVFFDERRRRLVRLPPAVVLDGIYCPGARTEAGRGCDRSCALLWAHEWLETAPARAGPGDGDVSM